jgi:hypothetical protein
VYLSLYELFPVVKGVGYCNKSLGLYLDKDNNHPLYLECLHKTTRKLADDQVSSISSVCSLQGTDRGYHHPTTTLYLLHALFHRV